ncbi:MAG: hypothetical protein ACREID_01455 [Planctomycetota bacterium]
MTWKASTAGILLLAGIFVLVVFAFARHMTLDRPALVGVGLGALAGALNLVGGYFATSRALRLGTGAAMRVVLAGFFARLVLLVGLTLLFHTQAWVNEIAFALSFLGFLCVFLAVEIRLVQRFLDRSRRAA